MAGPKPRPKLPSTGPAKSPSPIAPGRLTSPPPTSQKQRIAAAGLAPKPKSGGQPKPVKSVQAKQMPVRAPKMNPSTGFPRAFKPTARPGSTGGGSTRKVK